MDFTRISHPPRTLPVPVRSRRLLRLAACLLVLPLLLVSCTDSAGTSQQGAASTPAAQATGSAAGNTEPIHVVVSFDALREFVAAVGGDRVQITTIAPAGAELHDFEPKARDLAALSQAQLFVINGLGIEPWAEQAIQSANNPNLKVADTSVGFTAIDVGADGEHADHEVQDADHGDDEDHAGHSHEGHDPHIWLSLSGAQHQAGVIEQALTALDPAHQTQYAANRKAFADALQQLQDRFIPQITAAPRRSIVTGHAAFAYLCRDLGLEQKSVENTFAEGEPTARQLAELVEYCRTNKVNTIFAEQMASPEVSKTLAREVGAKVSALYTLEHAADNLSYLARQEKNLNLILESLKD